MSKIKVIRVVLLTLFLLFISFLIFSVRGAQDELEKPAVLDARESEVEGSGGGTEVKLDEFSRVEIQNGKKLWSIKAKEAQFVPEEGLTYLNDALLNIYRSENGIKILAKKAKVRFADDQMQKADLEGSVDISFDDGTEIFSQYLTFNSKDSEILAPGLLKVKTSQYEISGMDFVMDLDKEVFSFGKKVRSIFFGG